MCTVALARCLHLTHALTSLASCHLHCAQMAGRIQVVDNSEDADYVAPSTADAEDDDDAFVAKVCKLLSLGPLAAGCLPGQPNMRALHRIREDAAPGADAPTPPPPNKCPYDRAARRRRTSGGGRTASWQGCTPSWCSWGRGARQKSAQRCAGVCDANVERLVVPLGLGLPPSRAQRCEAGSCGIRAPTLQIVRLRAGACPGLHTLLVG